MIAMLNDEVAAGVIKIIDVVVNAVKCKNKNSEPVRSLDFTVSENQLQRFLHVVLKFISCS